VSTGQVSRASREFPVARRRRRPRARGDLVPPFRPRRRRPGRPGPGRPGPPAPRRPPSAVLAGGRGRGRPVAGGRIV